ncbi:MAG: MATE family efflux transporter [Pseudomonadota bacterium]
MTQARLQRILTLALPIIGGMVSQNILNIVDTAMVSRLSNSDAALAAVGLGGFALYMGQALILGISTGVQSSASRRKGEGRLSESAFFLNGGLFLVAVAAPILSLVLFFSVPLVYPYLNGDANVIELGVPYLEIRLIGTIFIGMNYAFRGYWNAIDMPHLYMSTLVVMHAANIFLNWVLIFGNLGAPAMGVEGAAWASVISIGIGTTIYFFLGFRHAVINGFMGGLPKQEELMTLIRLSIPNGLQQLFFSAGFVATFWIIGQVGTVELAAANVLINLTLVAILPGLGLGLAAATLVGQALGKKDIDDAQAWGWDVTKVAIVVMGVLGLPAVFFPEWLLTTVFKLTPETLAAALWPLRIVGMTMVFEALGMVLMNSMLGAGDTQRVMYIATGLQWLVFLPAAYLVGPVLGYGLLAIWLLQGTYRGLQAIVFTWFWQRKAWAKITI